MKIQINNEYECLKKVVVASVSHYDPTNLAINNETIKYFAEKGGAPTKEALLEEQKNFWETLRNHNVEVLEAQLVEGAKGQIFYLKYAKRKSCYSYKRVGADYK